MKLKRQSIKVATTNPQGEQVLEESVNALVVGALAIHPPLEGGGYCVTHIPSGYKMAEAWKLKSCRALVEKLIMLDIDWNFDAREPNESWTRQALPILREFNSTVDR